jgi:hypothetical protein
MAPSSSVTGAETIVHWILRIGVAACFIGHGAFGIITKAAWMESGVSRSRGRGG